MATPRAALLVIVLLRITPATVNAQGTPEWGGLLRETGAFYATRPNPSDAYAYGRSRLQVWSRGHFGNLFAYSGSADLMFDTHGDVDRGRWFDVTDRGIRQPAGSLSELFVDVRLRSVDVRIGKQPIRWGRADGFNP